MTSSNAPWRTTPTVHEFGCTPHGGFEPPCTSRTAPWTSGREAHRLFLHYTFDVWIRRTFGMRGHDSRAMPDLEDVIGAAVVHDGRCQKAQGEHT